MGETQQMEFKEFWRDDYLKWICGFANADGGVLQIGRNDQGEAVGIPDTEKLREAHSSRPYNPSVANAFFRAGEIEAWGRGIQRIIEACRTVGAPAPVLDCTPGDLWVEFPFAPDYLKASAETTQKPGAETSVETTVETTVKIMRLLGTHPEMTLREVALRIGKSIRAVERASVKLVKSGKLKRVGSKKGGSFEMTHLLERNHNDAFIAHLDRFMPQRQSCRDELNQFVL